MFIDQLSHEHKYAVIHISFSITILFCLFTLVSIHSGDRLIEYFKIEEKYPKLVRYILIRRKLKSCSFYWNTFIIFIMLLVIITFNIFVLIYR